VRGIRLTGDLNYLGARLESGAVWGSKLQGFLSQECVEGRPCRWTKGRAKVAVPLHPRFPPTWGLEIELSTGNPHGTGLCVRTNGRELWRDRITSGETWSKTVRFPEGLWHGPWLVVELLSDNFVPSERIKGSIDGRKLGVLVRKIGLMSCTHGRSRRREIFLNAARRLNLRRS
jgi:hypothetical protein